MTASAQAADLMALRKAFGAFVTGVTVVTTVDSEGKAWGFTANSFTSVSLDPPLVLVCLARTAGSYPVFQAAEQFGINILSEEQRPLASQFASKKPDKFSGVDWCAAGNGVPLLDGAAAFFACSVHDKIEAGDHLILVGRVLEFDQAPRTPLGYYSGNFVSLTLEKQAVEAATHEEIQVGGIFERDGCILFVEEDGQLRLPAGHTLGQDKHEPGSLFALLESFGVKASADFVYAVAQERDRPILHVYYRGNVVSGPSGSQTHMRLIPFDRIPWDAISIKQNVMMLQRYIRERSEARYSIYVGDTERGVIHQSAAR